MCKGYQCIVTKFKPTHNFLYADLRGIRKPSSTKSKSLTKQEIAEICKREVADDEGAPDEKQEVHRMQGLGYRK